MKKLVLALAGLLVIAAQSAAGAGDDGFLEKRGTELYLHGKPFYEISFNKFDLLWELLGAEFPRGSRTGFGEHPAASAENALRRLSQMGFQTIRAFCGVPETYFDPARREKCLATIDRMFDLCDRYDIRLVFCLGASDPYYAKACGETFLDTIAHPDSKSRALLNQYVRDMVLRYRDRKTIAMWEHANELLLQADIGGKKRVWNKITCPSLAEVARFHTDMAVLIHSLDPRHLVTTGDSFRYSQWHLYQSFIGDGKNMWGRDSLEELDRAVTMCQKGVDVYCIHYYQHGVQGANEVQGPAETLAPCLPADFLRFARAVGEPLYVGEYGVLARARNAESEKFWQANPGWFTSFTADRARAEPAVGAALDLIVAARAPLTHWWCYQSDRDMDQNDPQRMDVAFERDPELLRLFVEANRELQMATMGFTYAKPWPPK